MRFSFQICLVVLAVLLADAVSAEPRLKICFYPQRVSVCYKYADLLARIKPEPPALTLTEADIESVAADARPSERYVFRLRPGAVKRLDDFLAHHEGNVFGLSLDGKELFRGMVYEWIGAAAIDSPVIHFSTSGFPGELRLGAVQGSWQGRGLKGPSLDRINPRVLLDYFGDHLGPIPGR